MADTSFCEGNTRSTAVFIIKYLNSLGYSIGNEAFAKDSWYFRNALVRANYNDLQNGVHATTVYLEKFFENLLYNGNNELKNRYLHIDWHEENSAKLSCAKLYGTYNLAQVRNLGQNGKLKVFSRQNKILEYLS